MTDRRLRRAEPGDAKAVAAITADTWSDRSVDDYLADAFPAWVRTDGPDQRTAVVTVGGTVVAVCQGAMLTDDEAWLQGLRVHPDYRREGHGEALVGHLLDWCRDRGGTVARAMVFPWNAAGMGQVRAAGFDPVASCRWVRPEPAATGADPSGSVEGADDRPDGEPGAPRVLRTVDDLPTAYRFWTHSDARTALSGLALDAERTWAVAELDRRRLRDLAADGRVFAIVGTGRGGGVGDADDAAEGGETAGSLRGVCAMTARIALADRDGERVADYAVGAWRSGAAAPLFDAIRADAADCGADGTRVLIPDAPRYVSDAAVAGAAPGDGAVFVFAADLSRR